MQPDSGNPVRLLGLFAALALGFGCLLVLRPFLSALLWAAILVYSTWPAFRMLRERLRLSPCFAALLMAGLDGIQNKIHPGEAATKDLYHLPPEEDKLIPTVCASLEEALDALNSDREFLTRGGVFSDSMIDAYIDLKMQEVAYQASLAATARVLQPSLLDFLR